MMPFAYPIRKKKQRQDTIQQPMKGKDTLPSPNAFRRKALSMPYLNV
jgi:hypothetical protein